MRVKSSLIAILSLALIGIPAFAGTPLFGPKKFTRTTGKPNVYTETFAVGDTTATCTLKVYNGENGQNKLSSASIVLNGVEVVKESEFNQQVDSIVKPVNVKSNNRMTITLKSAPQGFVTVGVYGKSSSGVQLVWEKEYPIDTKLGAFSLINGGANPDTMFFVKDDNGISIFNANGNIVSTIPMTSDEFVGGISPNGRYIDIKRPNPAYYDSMGIDDPLPYICISRIVDINGNIISNYDKGTRRSHISNDGRHSLDRHDRMFGPSRLVFHNNGISTDIESMANITCGAYSPAGDMYVICGEQTMFAYNNTFQQVWATTFNTIDSFIYRSSSAICGGYIYFSPECQRIQVNLIGCGLLFDRNGNLIKRIDKRFEYVSFSPDAKKLCLKSENGLHFCDANTGNILWEHKATKGWYPTVVTTNNNVIALRDESMTEANSLCWLEVFSQNGELLFTYLLEGINLTKYGCSEIYILQASNNGNDAIIVWRNKIKHFRISGGE